MKPPEFLQVARDLLQKSECSAAVARTAISRAYYAVYLSCRDFLAQEIGAKVRTGMVSDHDWLQRMLLNCRVEEAVVVGRLLSNLHERRKVADYDMVTTTVDSKPAAQFIVEQAQIALDELLKCDTPQLRPRIAAGISQYRRLVQGS